jgi:hypothetical protein
VRPGRPEALCILGEYRTGVDQLGNRPDSGVIPALQRVGHADRGHGNPGNHPSECYQQVVDTVAGQHKQRPVAGQALLQQGLADGRGRSDGGPVTAGAPRSVSAALGDERIIRIGYRPRPQAVHDGARVILQRVGGSQ